MKLAKKLIEFVANFSLEVVKEHTLQVLRARDFTDRETMFITMVNGRGVGMASIAKSDYYPLPEIFPRVSSVFVTEDYCGHRISEKLIDFVNHYAKTSDLKEHISRLSISACMRSTAGRYFYSVLGGWQMRAEIFRRQILPMP